MSEKKNAEREEPRVEPVAWRCQFDGGPLWFYYTTEEAADRVCEGEANAGTCVIVKEPLFVHPPTDTGAREAETWLRCSWCGVRYPRMNLGDPCPMEPCGGRMALTPETPSQEKE